MEQKHGFMESVPMTTFPCPCCVYEEYLCECPVDLDDLRDTLIDVPFVCERCDAERASDCKCEYVTATSAAFPLDWGIDPRAAFGSYSSVPPTPPPSPEAPRLMKRVETDSLVFAPQKPPRSWTCA